MSCSKWIKDRKKISKVGLGRHQALRDEIRLDRAEIGMTGNKNTGLGICGCLNLIEGQKNRGYERKRYWPRLFIKWDWSYRLVRLLLLESGRDSWSNDWLAISDLAKCYEL